MTEKSKFIAKIIVLIGLFLFSMLIASSCEEVEDEREHHIKTRYFKVVELKTSGKRSTRGFYIEGCYDRIRYRDLRGSELKEGDFVLIQYDSIVDKERSVTLLDFPFRINNLIIK